MYSRSFLLFVLSLFISSCIIVIDSHLCQFLAICNYFLDFKMISPLEGVSPDRDTLMVGLFATLISGCLIWILYARLFHPFAEHPGPFLASVSRSWITWRVIRGDLEKSQRELHAKYGSPYLASCCNSREAKLLNSTLAGHIIRIAPNEVSISDPAAIKAIYSVNSGFTKVGIR
jgi:hypothetical protein